MVIIEELASYFLEVFNYALNTEKIVFPEKEGFDGCMVVPSDLSIKVIIEGIFNKWAGEKILSNDLEKFNKIDFGNEQHRPSELYTFIHQNGGEPDIELRGKCFSLKESLRDGRPISYVNAKEYLLITGFYKFIHGCFMDEVGVTHTSSLHKNIGGLRLIIIGHNPCDEHYEKFGFFQGYYIGSSKNDGVREIIF